MLRAGRSEAAIVDLAKPYREATNVDEATGSVQAAGPDDGRVFYVTRNGDTHRITNASTRSETNLTLLSPMKASYAGGTPSSELDRS